MPFLIRLEIVSDILYISYYLKSREKLRKAGSLLPKVNTERFKIYFINRLYSKYNLEHN